MKCVHHFTQEDRLRNSTGADNRLLTGSCSLAENNKLRIPQTVMHIGQAHACTRTHLHTPLIYAHKRHTGARTSWLCGGRVMLVSLGKRHYEAQRGRTSELSKPARHLHLNNRGRKSNQNELPWRLALRETQISVLGGGEQLAVSQRQG